MKKLVGNSLKEHLNERAGAEYISPEDFAGFVKCLIAMDNPSEATRAFRKLVDEHPTVKRQVQTDPQYDASVEMFMQAYENNF